MFLGQVKLKIKHGKTKCSPQQKAEDRGQGAGRIDDHIHYTNTGLQRKLIEYTRSALLKLNPV